jgi:hypothetical protein
MHLLQHMLQPAGVAMVRLLLAALLPLLWLRDQQNELCYTAWCAVTGCQVTQRMAPLAV